MTVDEAVQKSVESWTQAQEALTLRSLDTNQLVTAALHMLIAIHYDLQIVVKKVDELTAQDEARP